jgi:hypothetical protein
LGLELKLAVRRSQKFKNQEPWVVSLGDDYLAYFTTKSQYHEGGYESCLTLYGPDAGDKIIQGFLQIQKMTHRWQSQKLSRINPYKPANTN